jgi:pyruvate,water dikinase
MGKRYQEMLDNIGAYYYFPLAIAKDSNMAEGTATVKVKPLSGTIDQAGGLAFAIRDWSNYFVFRVNALEDYAVLFEFRNGRRVERASVDTPIGRGLWHHLRVEMSGRWVRAFLGDRFMLEYEADHDLNGHAGLWTKADSVTLFSELAIERDARQTR